MNGLRRKRSMSALALGGWILAAFFGGAQAEVGTTIDPATGDPASSPAYILFGIGDEPEPIGGAWIRYRPDGQSLRVLNEQGDANGDGDPTVLFNTVTGTPVVAWARNSVSGFDVVYSIYSGTGWTDPFVLAGSASDELDPHLTLDPATGAVHLFYWVDDAAPRVMHRQAPADLSSWSAPVQVSQPGEAARLPAAAFHEGELYVAYELHDHGYQQTPRQVVLSRREGQAYMPEVVAVTYRTGDVQPQVHSHAGRMWVDWIDAADELAWTRRDSNGQWEPIRYEGFVDAANRDFHVRPGIRLRAVQD